MALLLMLFAYSAYAQSSNLREKTILVTNDTLTIDTLAISPIDFQVYLNSQIITDSKYKVDYFKGKIFFDESLVGESVRIKYRVFPEDFSKVYSNKSTNIILDSLKHGSNELTNFSYSYDDDPYKNSAFGLTKTGSISRGITVGNNQDLSVNSNLNLQLAGKLTDDINVLASITDDNIPIQPQGNTQQLQDFDQVYIQLFNEERKLTAGDIWMNSQKSSYLRYNKRGQGAYYQQELKQKILNDTAIVITTAGIAVSKGKYARNIIQGVEGNQGPYRLTGGDNERFIVVLAGTERVFIDGVELKRGQEYDYIMDYNLSQIVFTPKQMITKDKRIIVEFQYSDKNYVRSMLEFSQEYNTEKFNASIRYFSEQDSKNQPLQLDLDTAKIRTLVNAGDDFTKMIFSGIDSSSSYNNSIVFYKKVDSLGYDVYIYSNNPEVAKYQLNFSDLGVGNGNYIEDQFSAQGRVYKWIKPDTTLTGEIIKKGQFEPVVLLTSPKKRQMISSSFNYKIKENFKVFGEAAISNNDLNTFSKIDSNDDVAFAGKFGFSKEYLQDVKLNWQATYGASGEFIQNEFEFIERFREAEFDRDWNIRGLIINQDQMLANGFFGFKNKYGTNVKFSSDSYTTDTLFKGFKQNLLLEQKNIGFNFSYKGSYLTTQSIQNTSFYRHKGYIDKSLGKITIGYKDETETNRFNDKYADTLLINSYSFYALEGFVKTSDTSKHSLSIFYKDRIDDKPKNNSYIGVARAKGFGLDYAYNKDYRNLVKTRLEYRELKILDSTLIFTKPENTIVGRVDYGGNWFKGGVTSNIYYEIGTGLEQKLQFVYLEVLPGQGNYQWVDYNEDNIKDLNEFEVAQFSDQAKYIRVFTPSNQYVKTFNNQFSLVTNINPSVLVNGNRFIGKFLSKLNNQTSITTTRKTNGDFTSQLYNPFFYNVGDVALSALNSSFRNVLFINRSGTNFGAEYTYQNSASKLLLTSGYDTRNVKTHEIRTRYNFLRKFEINLNGNYGYKLNLSEYTAQRNYNLLQQMGEFRFAFQPSTKFRLEAHSSFKLKNNTDPYGNEKGEVFITGTTLKFNAENKGLFQFDFNRIENKFNGDNNTPLEFEMLEGLKIGENYTWSLSMQRKIAKSLQLTLNYNGRKSPENKAVHFGGVQVRAYF